MNVKSLVPQFRALLIYGLYLGEKVLNIFHSLLQHFRVCGVDGKRANERVCGAFAASVLCWLLSMDGSMKFSKPCEGLARCKHLMGA